ncbi:MAG: hypothetical protein RJA63_2200 [Pseudomonadota bacterium]|jgi:hypothetical protein
MNAVTQTETQALAAPSGLASLRAPIPDHLISKLPKGTKEQNQCPAAEKINCRVCGGWHHPKIRHLDYLGHAAATHCLLDADPHWTWEPAAFDRDTGLPKFDATGGLWIKLTVCGVTRLGYGHADGKPSADAGAREKEVIGDAIRNAAMRFGLALDLWSKADLHADDDPLHPPSPPEPVAAPAPQTYCDTEFKANLPAWTKVLQSGRKTTDGLIAMVETKGKKFTAAQKAQIRAAANTTE